MQELFKKNPLLLSIAFAMPLLFVISNVYDTHVDQVFIFVFLVFVSFMYPRFLYDSGDKQVAERVRAYHIKNSSIYNEKWTHRNLFIILTIVFISIDCTLTFFGILFLGYGMEGNQFFAHLISQYGIGVALIVRAFLGALISFLFICVNEKEEKGKGNEKKNLKYSTYLILTHALLYIVLSGWIMFFANICFYGPGVQYQVASAFMYASILFISYKYYKMLKETLLCAKLKNAKKDNKVVRFFSGSLSFGSKF